MIFKLILMILLSPLLSCQVTPQLSSERSSESSSERSFQRSLPSNLQKASGERSETWTQFEKSFFLDLWNLYPVWASSLGLRQYDAQMRVPNEAFFEEQKAFLAKYKSLLDQMNPSLLSTNESVDYELVNNFLRSTLWELNTFKSHQWDPSKYNVGSSYASIVESRAAESVRLKNLLERLKITPQFYKAAYQNLTRPTKEHLHLAIQQSKGTLTYLQNTVSPLFKSNTNALGILTSAKEAIELYLQQLEKLNLQLQKTNGYKSFRIGPKLYNEKFALELQIDALPQDVYEFAKKEKLKTLKNMEVLSAQLWPKYFPKQAKPKSKKEMTRQILNRLAQTHAHPETFIDEVRAQIPDLWSFVKTKDLMDLDSTKILKVRTTPEYDQGFSVASIDAAGPFDKDKETFYNVTPLTQMSKEKAESFLREYNKYTLQILNIHEGIPGHYVQLVYSKKNPSLVKSIFGNGTMIEGWAVYAERMMLENGYGNHEPELWLMYSKWYLRVITNLLMDYEIHNKNLTRAQALKYLMDDAFQEKTEAELKWQRATYSQVQLASYFSGFSEIYRFREDMKKQKDFNLKKFHERFLSFGSAPIRDIIKLMSASPSIKQQQKESEVL